MSTWTDLNTTGYVVVRGFLGPDELDYLVRDYDTAPVEPMDSYPMRRVRRAALDHFRPRLDAVAAEITATAGVTANELEGAGYFATANGLFPWHQDVDSYLPFQDHLNYLNFYMPIIKPDPTKSNVCLVPMNRLAEVSPEAHTLVRGNGGIMCTRKAGRTEMNDMNSDGKKPLFDFDIEKIADTPHLSAGDLLLWRGDLLHRTQDSHTQRVSASFRYYNAKKAVSRAQLISGGVDKYVFLMKNRHYYQCIINAFDAAGADHLPAGHLVRYCAEHLPAVRSRPLSIPEFLASFTRPVASARTH